MSRSALERRSHECCATRRLVGEVATFSLMHAWVHNNMRRADVTDSHKHVSLFLSMDHSFSVVLYQACGSSYEA